MLYLVDRNFIPLSVCQGGPRKINAIHMDSVASSSWKTGKMGVEPLITQQGSGFPRGGWTSRPSRPALLVAMLLVKVMFNLWRRNLVSGIQEQGTVLNISRHRNECCMSIPSCWVSDFLVLLEFYGFLYAQLLEEAQFPLWAFIISYVK